MPTSGKIKWDDLNTSLQSDIATTVSGGGSGFIGYGFNPLGSIKRIDDNDANITYSVGDWQRNKYPYGREGLTDALGSAFVTQTTKVGATVTIKFVGTALYMNTKFAADQATIGINVDGVNYSNVDLSQSFPNYNYGAYLKIIDSLTYGFHTATITLVGKGANNTIVTNWQIAFFDILAQPVGKNLLPPFSQWNFNVGSPIVLSPYKGNVTINDKFIVQVPVTVGQVMSISAVSSDANGRLFAYANGASSVMCDVTGSGTIKTENFTIPSGTTSLEIRLLGTSTTQSTISNVMLNVGSTALPFETNGYDQVALATDSQWNKSSAFVGGNRVNATTNLTQSINEITNLAQNATFDRINPTWATVFQDTFDRANGAIGNGWIKSTTNDITVSSNQMLMPNTSGYVQNGDYNWTDRQIKFVWNPQIDSTYYLYPKNAWGTAKFARITLKTTALLGTNNVWFEDWTNGSGTANNATTVNIVKLTNYYITVKTTGSLYSVSITTNSDYATSATTIYYYNASADMNGNFGFEGNAIYDSVVVTAPAPDFWNIGTPLNNPASGITTAVYNGTVKINSPSNVDNGISGNYQQTAWTSSQVIPVVVGQIYTFAVNRKLSSLTSGIGSYLRLNWYKSDGTFIQNNDGVINTTIDTNFTQVSFSYTAPALAAFCVPSMKLSGAGIVEYQQPIFVASATVPAFHNKESRCDLICLQNDGTVVTTQGTGTSELGYRVEAEDGSISKFWRDKRTVQHWDRAKVWNSGTWTIASGAGSNNAWLESSTLNDSFYISFVGTGIDLLSIVANNDAIIGVTIDGGTEFLIDLYNPNTVYTVRYQLVRNLSYGQHTIKIRNTVTRNGLSQATFIRVDAFDIYVPAIPTNPSPNTLLPVSAVIKADPDYGWIRYDDTEGVLQSGGSWVTSTTASFYNGAETEGGTTNGYLDFTFIGSGVRWSGLKSTTTGIAQVNIDTVSQGTFDTYNASGALFGGIIYSTNLPLGQHSIRLINTGTKNASATGTSICLDAFDIKNTMYVIDLRKNNQQIQIENAIATHEAKDLWDAHPQAIKGMNNRERRESGSINATVATAGVGVTALPTFAKSFTVPPLMKIWITYVQNSNAGYITISDSVTTTGATIFVNSYTPQQITVSWEAIGY